MKRILLFMMLCVLATIGVRAEDAGDGYFLSTDTWFSNNSDLKENCVKVHLTKPGVLASAIDEIENGAEMDGITLKDCQVIYINSTENGAISDDDLDALSRLGFATIDLQDATWTASQKTFTNSSVKNLILPDNWTKAEVNACGQAIAAGNTNFGSCLSQGTGKVYDKDCNLIDAPSVIAYVNKGNTLKEAMSHTFMDNKANTKLGAINQNNISYYKLKALTISGNPVACDFTGGSAQIPFSSEGHLDFDQPADEKSGTSLMGIDGNTRELRGTATDGAVHGANLLYLDLRDAKILDQYNEDLTFGRLYGTLSDQPTNGYVQLWFPQCTELKTIPADCVDVITLREVCIPSNIETIRTRAFKSVDHIWTTAATGDVANTVYDNGIFEKFGEEAHYGYTGILPSKTNEAVGTYTFSSNLKLIESNAFPNTESHVSDVYVLAETAPECHVDAFNVGMYISNSGYNVEPDEEQGIVTRDKFKNNGNYWITMLHFPRECGTPDVQRYTDPTREYSIATGMTDGKGATIYFPNAAEFLRAYLQGTTGYTWNAWNTERDGLNGFTYSPTQTTNTGWTQSLQALCNDGFNVNPNKAANPYTSFYDVTANGNLPQPEGLLKYYYVNWDERNLSSAAPNQGNLYPQAVYVEGSGTATENVHLKDAEGYPAYEECEDGSVIRDYTMEEATNGAWVRTTVTENAEGAYVQDYSFLSNTLGEWVREIVIEEVPNGEYVKEYSYEPYTGTPVEGKTYYYHAFTQVGSNFDRSNYANYYYPGSISYQRDDINGTYIWQRDVQGEYANDWYATFAQAVEYWHINVNDYPHYSLVGSDWTQCTSADEANNKYYNGGVWEYSTSYSVWSESVGEVDLFTKEYTDNYITYDSERDAADEPRYNVEDNGYRKYNGSEDDNYDRFNKSYKLTYRLAEDNAADNDETHYDVDYNTYRKYTTADAHKGFQRYNKAYVPHTYRAINTSGDFAQADAEENPYCPVYGTVYKDQTISDSKDYRGWHQFVLTGYASNTTDIVTMYRSYITDDDWWTICLPYDLTYNEMMLFYGDLKNSTVTVNGVTKQAPRGEYDETKKPYLSLLTNVVRDVKDLTITLNFSKNLMTYKHTQNADGSWTVSDEELTAEDKQAGSNYVVLHKGVPYMIRPCFPAGNANRQFDIYGTDQAGNNVRVNEDLSDWRVAVTNENYPGLYAKLMAAQELDGRVLRKLQEDGLYTVPALIANKEAKSSKISNAEISVSSKTVTYDGVTYPVSDKHDYTFVGAFFNNVLPPNGYFLGWQGRARFFYNDNDFVGEGENGNDEIFHGYNWNNHTGVIVPNMLASTVKKTTLTGAEVSIPNNLGLGSHNGKVTEASGSGSTLKPARWCIFGAKNDWFGEASTGAKSVSMVFGVDIENETAGIEEVTSNEIKAVTVNRVYTINGQYVGNSLQGLSRGIYIQNGKKIVVK